MILPGPCFTHEIMFQNKIAAKINTEDGFFVIENGPLPMDLRCKPMPQSIKDRVENVTEFKEWCAGRTLMMSQRHAKKICNALNLSQDTSVDNKAKIALAYHCSTLSDCYWVRKAGEYTSYKEVSLFRNTSRNILTPVSLGGKSSSLFAKQLKNWSDIGADGTLAKSWIRENGTYYLYKTGDNTTGEVAASKCLASVGAHTILYTEEELALSEKEEPLRVTRCPCFTSEDYSFIPFKTLVKNMGFDAISYVKENFLTDYANMAVATYLVGNEDLHDKNWGLLFDNRKEQITGLAPLFDFDGCFLYYQASKSLKFLPECAYVNKKGEKYAFYEWNIGEVYTLEGPTIEEAALQYAPYCTLNLETLTKESIPASFQEEFASRVACIEAEMEKGKEKE